jgi:hypothetical protein
MDYPSESTLKVIREWDLLTYGVDGLLELVRNTWKYESYFRLKGKRVRKLELHTGGWSGNEDILVALEKNTLFFTLYWDKEVRGGHFYFTIRPIKK